MKATIRIFILLAAVLHSRIVFAQVPQTNADGLPLTISNLPPTSNDPLIPLMQFEDVPITMAIANLARQVGINYIIDPNLIRLTGSAAQNIPEPLVTLRLTNVTAREVPNRMISLRQFVMIEDPTSHIARITSRDQATNAVDASLLGSDTTSPASTTNALSIPLIQFQDVPLAIAIKNLIQQSKGTVIEIDPQLEDPGNPRYNAITLSVHWENITASQALVALCLNYDLVIVKDPTTGVIQIKPKPRMGSKLTSPAGRAFAFPFHRFRFQTFQHGKPVPSVAKLSA